MRKVRVIAAREYLAAVRSKAFVVSLVFMPLMLMMSAAIKVVLTRQEDHGPRRFAVVDRTPGRWLAPILEREAEARNAALRIDPATGAPAAPPFVIERIAAGPDRPDAVRRHRLELSRRVLGGALDGILEIGPEVLEPPGADRPAGPAAAERAAVRYQSNRPLDFAFPEWAAQVINHEAVLRRGRAAGLSRAQAGALVRPVPIVARGPSTLDPRTGSVREPDNQDPFHAAMVPMGLTVLMLMMLMVGTSPLLQGVMEEKGHRIAEVLLGSVRPFDLMAGKLVGIVGVSLTSVAVYLVAAFVTARRFGLDEALTPGVVGWFLLFQILGVVMYGSLFIAVGAACNDAKEAQSLLMPVMLIVTAPLFAIPHILQDPNSAFATGLSFFPFTAPMILTSRLALPPGIPWWQPPLGALLVLATTTACVYVGGRIFRIGLLTQGKGVRLGDVLRWIVRG